MKKDVTGNSVYLIQKGKYFQFIPKDMSVVNEFFQAINELKSQVKKELVKK